MIRRIRSNGCRLPSSRFPITRVSSRMNAKTKMARRTRSIDSGEDGDRAVDVREDARPVEQLDVLCPVPRDVRRVHLELHEEDVRLASGDVPEREDEPPVVAALREGRGLDGVHVHALGPAGIEDQLRLAEVAL